MQVELTPIEESSAVRVEIKVPADQAQQEFNKACRRVGQRVNVPGFRRGKAPLRMIEKAVGTDTVKQEALDRYLPYIFADVISDNKLDVVAPPRVRELEFEIETGIRVVADVDIRPTVTLPEDLKLNVDVEKAEDVENGEEREVASMLERIAKLESIEGREKVEEKDIVILDFKGTLEEEEIPGGSAEDFQLDLSNNHFIESFTTQLLGKPVNEEFTMDVDFPEDYFDESLAGKKATFVVTVKDVKEYKVPELSDDVAPELGNYKTAEDVKVAVKERLKKRAEMDDTYRKQRATVNALVEATKVAVPEGMIQREVESIMEEMSQRFEQQGLNFQDFVKSNQAEMQENFRAEARQRIKTSLAFAEVAAQEKLTLEEKEFEVHIKEMAHQQNVEEKVIMKQLAQQPNGIQSLTDQLLAQKVVDLLINRASFTMVDPQKNEPALEGDVGAKSEKKAAKPKKAKAQKEEVSQEIPKMDETPSETIET